MKAHHRGQYVHVRKAQRPTYWQYSISVSMYRTVGEVSHTETYIQYMFMLRHLSLKHPLSFFTPPLKCVFLFIVLLRSQRERERERGSIKTSRLSVGRCAQRAERSGTAAFSLLISSIDCLNGCHWRWRDRQAAFVRATEQSCGAPLNLILH